MKTKICPLCKEEKDLNKFQLNADGSIRKHVCIACRGKQDRAKLKLDALNAFGGKCNCCGEKHPYFLTLDHINNDGAKAREIYNEQQIYREARRENWPKDKYQLLCMNCNFAKGHFLDCPHKLNISVEQAYEKLRARLTTYSKSNVQYNISGLSKGPQIRHQQAVEKYGSEKAVLIVRLRKSGLSEELIKQMTIVLKE